jgi:hypothetical protein
VLPSSGTRSVAPSPLTSRTPACRNRLLKASSTRPIVTALESAIALASIDRELQRSLLKVDVTEIIIHEADEPDAVVNFLDAERLTRKNR